MSIDHPANDWPRHRSSRLPVTLLGVLALSLTLFSNQGYAMHASKWFPSKTCTSLTIAKHKSAAEHQSLGSIEIQDLQAIQTIMARIAKMPVDGDEMISFGPKASHTSLTFVCNKKPHVIDIYQGGFKTPSTGFNSSSDEQSALVVDLESLAMAEVKAAIWKLEKVPVSLGDFTITYNGSENRDKKNTTASITISTYTVRDNDKKEQELRVVHGQIPPQPLKFEVNGKKMTLLSYEAKKGKRLYPNHYQIESRWF